MKPKTEKICISAQIPRELAEKCIAFSGMHPEEFSWGAFVRSRAREFVARKEADPRARLAAALHKTA